MIKKILIVDDEESILSFFKTFLKRLKSDDLVFEGSFAKDGKEALSFFEKQSFDLVVSDLKMPNVSGMELLSKVKKQDPQVPFIMMTAFDTTATAVQAMKLGAYDYIVKPFNIEELKLVIFSALQFQNLKEQNRLLNKELKNKYQFQNLIGNSQAMHNVFEQIKQVSNTSVEVLITGESGTGKEMVAKAIHFSSSLNQKPFVTVNCGALSESLIESELFGHKKGSFTGAIHDKAGLFEAAHGGTLFLDEIGEMPMSLQVKLLRVLQERKIKKVGSTEDISVSVRLMAATNRDLQKEVQEGNFREDLFYRLNVVPIHLSPLRERPEDIQPLAEHFLQKHSLKIKNKNMWFSKEALYVLEGYHYPGNVRELENIVERAIVVADQDIILKEHLLLPKDEQAEGISVAVPPSGLDLENYINTIEKKMLTQALQKTNGVKTKAAKLLSMSLRSFRYRLQKHGMDF